MTQSREAHLPSIESLPGNSWFVLIMFWVTLLCQDTALKYIWGFGPVARLANLVALGLMSIYAMHALMFRKFDLKIWCFYLLPGLLVFAGMLLNVTRNTLRDPSAVSYYGLVLPWAAYLTIPALLKTGTINSERLWRLFYYFMVTAVILGLSDYAAVFIRGASFHLISTPYGPFMAGRFSLLYTLENGIVYPRFYAWFLEPGTLAMFSLPALAYAAFHKRYLGAAILLVGFYYTHSLGGLISLMILLAVLVFVKSNRGHLVVPALLLAGVVGAAIWMSVGDYVVTTYKQRSNSRTVRESDFRNTVVHLPAIVVNRPMGFKLGEQASDKGGKFDYGTNFTVGNALQVGGVGALIGYVMCLLIAVACSANLLLTARDLSVHQKVVFSSIIVLIPFIVQRTVVWDSPMFAFLFAPSLIDVLRGHSGNVIAKIGNRRLQTA